MLIGIDDIKVAERIRKDFGDIEELAKDIKENGLINPIVISQGNTLIAGERRLKALKSLGYIEAEVRVMNVDDYEQMLNLEISENETRKDFSKLERIEYARRLERIERVKARDRKLEGRDLSQNSDGGRTDEKVAKKLQIGSRDTYRKEKYIADNADEKTLKEWDSGDISTHKAYTRIKELEEENQGLKKANEELSRIAEKAPEVIEKEVIREVKPSDYEEIKRMNKLLQDKNNELELKARLSKLNDTEENEKLKSELRNYKWLVLNFVKNATPLLNVIEQIKILPKSEQELFKTSSENLLGFATNLYDQTKGI